MTCVVGLVQYGKVYLGADSASVNGFDLMVCSNKKVFRNGAFGMGFTTSWRMGQLLAHAFAPPKPRQDQDLFAFMATDFVDAVRACLKSGGYASRDGEVESGGTFLVGYQGRLFAIDSDYHVAEPTCGFAAVGCGAPIALGSLYSTEDNKDPFYRLHKALLASEAFSAGVRSPMHTEMV